MSKQKMKKWRAFGTAAYRVPWLTASFTRHTVLPSGWRWLAAARRDGLEAAHWRALGEGLVRFCQESGPVLTKLGQILATRNDLLPSALCARLEALYDKQPAMSARDMERLLTAAFGNKRPFAEFDQKALAVGSVGEVHRARLQDGTGVIVKIARPGSLAAIRRDIRTLQAVLDLVVLVQGEQGAAVTRVLRRMLEDLEAGFVSELDLKSEARALERFRKRMRSNSRVYIPKVYKELSSRDVLVVEEIKGEPLAKFRGRGLKANKALAETVLREILTQIFEEGSFHADPHAGNFLVMEDGRLGMIDFGLTGEFTGQDRKKIARAVKAFIARDADAVVAALLEFGTTPKNFKPDKFKKEVFELLGEKKISSKALQEGASNLEELVNDLFTVAYRHQVHVPRSTTLLIKTLVTVEGVARSLDPEVKLLSVAAPVILRSLTPRWLRFISVWT